MDPEPRVRWADGVRAAEAWAMPGLPAANIDTTAIVIAENAAITGWESSVVDNSEPAHGEVRKDPGRFREVLSVVPSGIAVVTAVDGGEPVGLTVGSLIMVSTDPSLVGFLPGVSSTSFTRIRRSGSFCVNVLTARQENVSNALAKPGGDKFAGLSWRPAPVTGSPVLEGVAAWIDCRLTAVHEHGDHFVAIGEAVDFDAVPGEQPLVFHRGRYVGLETGNQALA
ncbi:flavin reductase [Streptomyces sp. NPDC086519]|uniref:flavin reductase family protein n=1 Tax=unclassified Streptomyces TaxID=2593676 RepID=UPI0034394080